MRKFWLPVLFGLAAAALPAGASADRRTHSKLTAIAGQGAGIVEVAPTGDETAAVHASGSLHCRCR